MEPTGPFVVPIARGFDGFVTGGLGNPAAFDEFLEFNSQGSQPEFLYGDGGFSQPASQLGGWSDSGPISQADTSSIGDLVAGTADLNFDENFDEDDTDKSLMQEPEHACKYVRMFSDRDFLRRTQLEIFFRVSRVSLGLTFGLTHPTCSLFQLLWRS